MFNRERKISFIEEKFPLAAITGDGLSITKGGQIAAVLELRGRDYSGIEQELSDSLFMGRKRFFDSLPSEITVLHQSHRLLLSQELKSESYSIPLAKIIAEQWSKNFKDTFRTRHFLIFVTAADNIEEQIMLATAKRNAAGIPLHLLQILRDTVDDTISKLQAYNPRQLVEDDLASYWAWLINGMHVYQRCPNSGRLEGILAETILAWPDGKPYQIYRGARERLSAWLVIQAPPSETRARLMDTLFACRHEFSLFQTFARYDKTAALDAAEDRLKNAQSFGRASEISVLECEELMQRLSADEISLLRHRWALEVFAEDLPRLETAVTEIRNLVGSFGIRCAREWVNQEACFWSRFPELQNCQSRVRSITSENAPHFASFPTIGEGFDCNPWGKHPVARFKTLNLSDYGFIYHMSPDEKNSLGNTGIIGGSGSGKTTLISFLQALCFKFDKFRAYNFDCMYGMEVYTRCMGGKYIGTKELNSIEMNPLLFEDSIASRTFYAKWFVTITGKDSDKDKEKISNAIKQLYSMPKECRQLKELIVTFGLPEQDSIARALLRWLPDGEYGAFFNGKSDALDINSLLVSFDMTTILDLPEVLPAFVEYIFHKIFINANGDPYQLVVDEMPRYLANPIFSAKIDLLLQQIRKTNGVFIGASQDAPTILESKNATKFLNNISTWILFPEPKAIREHYIDRLNLNENEFSWIKTTDPFSRQFMVKKKDGECVILNGDLKSLGQYRKVFNSGADAVRRLEEFRREYPNAKDWLQNFLND